MTEELLAHSGRLTYRFPFTLGLLLSIAAFVPSARAQRVYLGGLQGAHLSRQDADAFRLGVRRLLDHKPVRVGHTQAWSGPSGIHGTMTIRHIFEKSDMPCREVHSTFIRKEDSHRKQYNFTICRTPEGDWKLAD